MSKPALLDIMMILWEGEGHSWDELYEYPYSDGERKAILSRLQVTAEKLQVLFSF